VSSGGTNPDISISAATTLTDGSMSAGDKLKLDGIQTGAEVNQNAYSNFTVGATTISANSKTDTLTFIAGTNITLTPNAGAESITISSTGGGGGSSTPVEPSMNLFGQRNAGSTATAAQSVEANQNIMVTAVVSETEITNVQGRANRIRQSAEL